MPFVNVVVNVDVDSESVGRDVTRAIASGFNKPEAYVMVNVNQSHGLMFAGTKDPCAMVEVMGIGGTVKDVLGLLTQAVSNHGIPASRIFINFSSFQAHEWAVNGQLVVDKK